MSDTTAFIGDIHGNLSALRGLWRIVSLIHPERVVFLGDYINKGHHSAEVMEDLVSHWMTGFVTLLAGNHESSLRQALETGDLGEFLRIGGAATIRSYIGGAVGPDVASELRECFPATHLSAFRSMPSVFETQDLLAQHVPPVGDAHKFVVSGHIPVGLLPRITRNSAQIDTGCGKSDGRLTALLWPNLEFLQVNASGEPVRH